MEAYKLYLLVGCCILLCGGIASASIAIDETFEDGTPFTDLGWVFGTDNPNSATIKGISVYRDPYSSIPATATLSYNATPGNLQGSLEYLGPGMGRAWKLTPGQKIFWGQSGNPLYPSGNGIIADESGSLKIAQVGLAFDKITDGSSATLIGSVSYLFGNTAQSTTTFSLTYELRLKDSSSAAELSELRSDGTSRTLGFVVPRKFSILTTVWAGGRDIKWGTIPKTVYSKEYPPPPPNFPPRKPDWAIYSNVGSADGCLYPNGKGWINGAALTGSSAGITSYTAVYSFLDTKPSTSGAAASIPYFADKPWLIPNVFYGTTISTTQTLQFRTWKIAAGDTNASLYVDDLYLESSIRNSDMSFPDEKAADYRLHEFDQTKRYRRIDVSTLLPWPNRQYVEPFDPSFQTAAKDWTLY